MIKVGFYLDNDTISSVDCTCILKGNPGIGGTEYMVIAVAQLLTIRSNDIQVKLFAPQRDYSRRNWIVRLSLLSKMP